MGQRPSLRARTLLLLGTGVVLLAACAPTGAGDAAAVPEPLQVLEEADEVAHVYRSATCECCGDHAEHLEASGFDVIEHTVEDVDAVKAETGVPDALRSCHTTLVGGYAVEGHVPADVITRAMEQQPDVDGIGLAGMPPGSPGMGGELEGPLDVREFSDGRDVGAAH